MYIHLIYTSQKTHFPFQTNCLTLFREAILFSAIYIQPVEKIRSSKMVKHVIHFVIIVPEHRYLWSLNVALHTASNWHFDVVKRSGVADVRGSVDVKGLLEKVQRVKPRFVTIETNVFKDMFIMSFASMEIYGLLMFWRALCVAAVPSVTKLMNGLSATETRSVCQHFSLQNVAVASLSKRHLLSTGARDWLLDVGISCLSSLPARKRHVITSHCTTLSSFDIILSRVFATSPMLRHLACAPDIAVNKSPLTFRHNAFYIQHRRTATP